MMATTTHPLSLRRPCVSYPRNSWWPSIDYIECSITIASYSMIYPRYTFNAHIVKCHMYTSSFWPGHPLRRMRTSLLSYVAANNWINRRTISILGIKYQIWNCHRGGPMRRRNYLRGECWHLGMDGGTSWRGRDWGARIGRRSLPLPMPSWDV